MASSGTGRVLPVRESHPDWKNYKVHWVEDASTLWVREIPSVHCSAELKNFKQLEKQLNSHFKRNFKKQTYCVSNYKTGEIVVVCYKGQYYRGRVESVTRNQKNQVVEVFLLDYATRLKTVNSSIELLEPGKWTSVPYQAKRVKLFAITPLTLDYSVLSSQMKLVPKVSMKWDEAATNFVEVVFQREHTVEFGPVVTSSDGCVYGLLTVTMKEEEWEPVKQSFPNMLPKLLAITAHGKHGAREDGYFREDLARMLVNLGFADYEPKVLEVYSKMKQNMKDYSSSDESMDSEEKLKDSRQPSYPTEPRRQNTKMTEPKSDMLKEEENLSMPRQAHWNNVNSTEKVGSRPPLIGCGRGMFSFRLPRNSTPLSSVGSSSIADTAGAVGSPESRLSDDDSSSSLSSFSRNRALSSFLETAGGVVSSSTSDMDTVGMTRPGKRISQQDILKSGITQNIPLDAAPKENGVLGNDFGIPEMSEIPVKSNPTAVLTSQRICFSSDSRQHEDSLRRLPDSLVPKASIIAQSRREGQGEEFISPFEGLTSSVKSDSLKGINVVPSLDTGLLRKVSDGVARRDGAVCRDNGERGTLQEHPNTSRLKENGSLRFKEGESQLLPQLCESAIDVFSSKREKTDSPGVLISSARARKSVDGKVNGTSGHFDTASSGFGKYPMINTSTKCAASFNVKTQKRSVPQWVCKQLMQELQSSKQEISNDAGAKSASPTHKSSSLDKESSHEQILLGTEDLSLGSEYLNAESVSNTSEYHCIEENLCEVVGRKQAAVELDRVKLKAEENPIVSDAVQERETIEARDYYKLRKTKRDHSEYLNMNAVTVSSMVENHLEEENMNQIVNKKKASVESGKANLKTAKIGITLDEQQERAKNKANGSYNTGKTTSDDIKNDDSQVHEEIPQELNASFMSDARDLWTDEKVRDLVEGEFSSLLLQKPGAEGLNIAKLFRVYVAGEVISDGKVIVNEEVMRSSLNTQVARSLKNAGMKATRLQAYAWPAICCGSSTVIVGDRYSGKTYGYMVPLVSTIIDCWQFIQKRLYPGIGAIMVIVCNDWRRAKCAADSIINLLPEIQPAIRVMTAWGGCGNEEVNATKIQLLKGCDVLITTPPCLVRLITGKPTVQGNEHNQETRETPTTTLNRCCYFVIDDADLTLDNFTDEIKQLLKWWGEGQQTFHRQIVVTSSAWTPSLNSLIKNLFAILNPTIIISSPGEAAVCSHVSTHVHHVQEEHDILIKVGHLIRDTFMKCKNLVFVKGDKEASMLKCILKSASIYCVCVSSRIVMWELKRLVHEWHDAQALTMIVSEKSVYHLLHHNLANADVIFHPYVPQTVSKLMMRYAFLVENFSTDLQKANSKCESHVILTERNVQSNPDVVLELNRLCKQIPKPLLSMVPRVAVENVKHKALCYYLKAYGSCPEKHRCRFRHEIKITDVPRELPRLGEVSFSVVKILNASRFLVRLNEYREKTDSPKVSLEFHYLKLFCALQKHYSDVSNHKNLEYAEVGMLCVVNDKGNWARAKIDSIDHSKDTAHFVIFLIDEGSEITTELKSVFLLHPKFSRMPGLIAEVYLCCVKPFDSDTEWTFHASHYMNEVFKNHAIDTQFMGRIILSLNLTLWLSPVVEVIRVGKAAFQKGSLRSRLINLGYGEDNKEHMKSLEEQCAKAGINLVEPDLYNGDWLSWLDNANNLLENCDSRSILENEASRAEATVEKKNKALGAEATVGSYLCTSDQKIGESRSSELPENPVAKISLEADDNSSLVPAELLTNNLKNVSIAEELPLHVKLEVKIALVESCDCFFIQREDRIDSLEELEDEIARLTKGWGEDPKETRDGLPWDPSSDVLPDSYCLAKFTDDSYYRGWVESDEPSGTKKIFFIDYGETLTLPCSEVQPCPHYLLEKIPAQAIPCYLAHVTVPALLQQKAVDAMNDLADNADVWMLKAIGVKDSEGERCYIVELECDDDPPRQMWRELVREGFAVHELEDSETSSIQNEETDERSTSNSLSETQLDSEEAFQFMRGIPTMQTHLENMQHECNRVIEDKKEMERKENCKEKANHSLDSIESVGSLTNSKTDKRSVGDERSVGNGSPQKVTGGVPGQHNHQGEREALMSHTKLSSSSRAFHDKCLRIPPLQAVEGVTTKLSPQMYWSENDEQVILKIHLIGVQLYRSRLGSSRITFMSLLGDKFYVVDEGLEGEIDADQSSIQVKGMAVVIRLVKAQKKNMGVSIC